LRVSDAAPTAGNCNYPRSNHHGHSELIIIYGKRYDDEPYTEEEGDYILYAYCDRRRAWKEIVEEFTSMFGEKRRRTLGSLQTHFYLMNQRIPEWDKQGFLKFDNEHDLKPKQFSCKSRKVNVKHLGLGERYPERAIHYKWVEEADKIRWKDWGISIILRLCCCNLLTTTLQLLNERPNIGNVEEKMGKEQMLLKS
jgi:hypothetical protein